MPDRKPSPIGFALAFTGALLAVGAGTAAVSFWQDGALGPAKQMAAVGCDGLLHVDPLELGWAEAQRVMERELLGSSRPVLLTRLSKMVQREGAEAWEVRWRRAFDWTFSSLAASEHANVSVPLRRVGTTVHTQFNHLALQTAEQFEKGELYLDVEESAPLGGYLEGVASGSTSLQLFSIGKGLDDPEIAPLPQLSEDFPIPPFLKAHGASRWNPLFSAGGAARAVAHHTHGRAWLATVRGSKRWYLHPPNATPGVSDERYVGSPTAWAASAEAKALACRRPRWWRLVASWALRAAGRDAAHLNCSVSPPLVCEVRAGDAILLPPFWWHATVNTAPCLAVGHQQSASPNRAYGDSEPDYKRAEASWPRAAHVLDVRASAAATPRERVAAYADSIKTNPYNFATRAQHFRELLGDYAQRGKPRTHDAVVAAISEIEAMLARLKAAGSIGGDEVAYVLQYLALVIEVGRRAEAGGGAWSASRLSSFSANRAGLLRRASEHAPDDGELRARAALAQCEHREDDKCVRALRSALALRPDLEEASALLARLAPS